MMYRLNRHSRFLLLGFAWLLVTEAAEAQQRTGVIVQCVQSCDTVIQTVRNRGGDVTYRYENIDAIAATIPDEQLAAMSALSGIKAVVKDVVVSIPRPVESPGSSRGRGAAVATLEAEQVLSLEGQELADAITALPQNYNFNNNLTGAAVLHSQGNLGQDVIVAVIDSGTANSPVVPALSGTVVGGENFVPLDPVQSATSRRNGPHGTWVGSMIASHVAFGFFNTSSLVRSLKLHSPESIATGGIFGACPNPPVPAVCFIPMIGTAPASKIYALKVFDSRGGGAPFSRIIAAMDRAITLRRNFNMEVASVPVAGNGTEEDPFRFNSLNIQVVNMSLGGPTLFAGRDLQDQLTLEMLNVGITLVASAGNDGFAAMTGGSPGTGIGTLTVGAASTSVHERVLRDLQRGVGVGALFRPTSHHQTAFFSSRGPTADGRSDPDVIANGVASFVQGTCASCLANTSFAPISLVSGTSFSSPTTAGAAALLRRESPSASAAQVRNALIASASPNVLGDGSGPIDQGAGFINLPGARALLTAGTVGSDVVPEQAPGNGVRQNIAGLSLEPVNFIGDLFSTRVENLRPGQVAQFFVRSRTDTDRLVVRLRNVTPELPANQQNSLFGDDIFLNVVDAPTSFGDFRVGGLPGFVREDATFNISNPQSGLVRVALQGDWTNAGKISADLEIEQQRSSLVANAANGKIGQGELIPLSVNIPAGTAQAVFELFWQGDWAAYPTNDIDLILRRPSGAVSFAGATLASPERVVINNPPAGTWTVFVNGFTVFGERDNFVLRVTADGNRLRAQ